MTPLENQVSNLELSKRLKELGVPQESFWWWRKDDYGMRDWQLFNKERMWKSFGEPKKYGFSAFTEAELIERLGNKFGVLERFKDGTFGAHVPNDCGINGMGDTPANAVSALLIYLLENKLIDLKGGKNEI